MSDQRCGLCKYYRDRPPVFGVCAYTAKPMPSGWKPTLITKDDGAGCPCFERKEDEDA